MSEDCIAMSEDGDWYAFSRTMKRGQVMAALADSCLSWWDAIHAYKIRAGFVHVSRFRGPAEREWAECDATDLWAEPCWIVTRV